jgi:hypothetical protein
MRIGSKAFGYRAIGAIATSSLLLASAPSPAQEKGEGPASLFLTYKCDPARRGAFRAHMAGPGIAQFEKWKKEGVFKDYLLLFSSYVNRSEQDLLARLDFAKYVDTERWKVVEQTMPGGLSAEGLALCTPEKAYLADLTWEGGPSESRNLGKAVYLYIPYHFEKGIGKPEYKKYFEVYVKPQNDGWLTENALSWWGVYLNQHNTGMPWDALFLYEYRDAVGLAQRDNVKQSVRAKLRSNPEWKAVSDNKASVRIEDEVIMMDPILPR